MSRDSNGTYTLPAPYNPVTTLTKITSAWANTTLTDLATEVTNSLDRNGRGPMLARLKLINGDATTTALGVGNANNGFYWVSANLTHVCVGVPTFTSEVDAFQVPLPGGAGLAPAGHRTKTGRGFNTNYTTTAEDITRILVHDAGDAVPRTLTIDNAASAPNGGQMTVFNPLTSGALTLTITGGTLTRLSSGAVGNRTIAAGGYVLLERINNNWYIVTEFGVT